MSLISLHIRNNTKFKWRKSITLTNWVSLTSTTYSYLWMMKLPFFSSLGFVRFISLDHSTLLNLHLINILVLFFFLLNHLRIFFSHITMCSWILYAWPYKTMPSNFDIYFLLLNVGPPLMLYTKSILSFNKHMIVDILIYSTMINFTCAWLI